MGRLLGDRSRREWVGWEKRRAEGPIGMSCEENLSQGNENEEEVRSLENTPVP